MKRKQGYFISFEGIEGVGKTTAIEYVRQQLEAAKISYVVTREPGGTPIAEEIRTLLLNCYSEKMSEDTELLLMFAGRAQNISQVILPALEEGKWVLSDRFTDASFAYQGGGRGILIKHIEELAKWVQGDLKPDLTLLLDAPVSIALPRIESRGAKDRIEAEGLDFFERVRNSYLAIAQCESERVRVIHAEQDLLYTQKQILEIIKPLIN